MLMNHAKQPQTALLQRILRSRLLGALTYPHSIDGYLEAIHPLWSAHQVRACITAVRHTTPDSVTLSLRPNRNWAGFLPGQFVQLNVVIDGVRRSRCYSPAHSAQAADGLIELSIKAQGTVSRYLYEQARPGMVLDLSQAQGEFYLPTPRPRRIVLISGGSGITPVMAMLRTLLNENHPGKISFLHYARTPHEVIYAAELAVLAAACPQLELIPVYTRQTTAPPGSGRFSAAQLRSLVPDFATAETFLCGPAGLMSAVQQVWAENGCSARLHLEHFTSPGATQDSTDAIHGEVVFARSERYVANNGRSLLDQAEAAGLTPQSGCRMGICSTCCCRKSSGTVRNTITGRTSSEANEDIRICVSVPIGDVALDL